MKTIQVLSLFFLFCITACSQDVKLNEIPGVYKANFQTKGIYISLFKDGTCKIEDSLSQKTHIKAASWTLKGNTINIQMDEGIWPAKIENEKGTIRIVYASDVEDYFNKTKNF